MKRKRFTIILGVVIVLTAISTIVLHATPSLAVRTMAARVSLNAALTGNVEKTEIRSVAAETYRVSPAPIEKETGGEFEYFIVEKGDGLFRYTAQFYYGN